MFVIFNLQVQTVTQISMSAWRLTDVVINTRSVLTVLVPILVTAFLGIL